MIARLLFVLAALLAESLGARLDVIEIPGRTLRGNPLGDPEQRRVAVFTPDKVEPHTLVIYLPGWGGSSEDAIAQGRGAWFGQVVNQLAAAGLPVRIAVVDGRSRYGGSQFLNSNATGNYADYVAQEIAPALLRGGGATCLIAGHSSGAFGALHLAMTHPRKFSAVVALSPDSDFDITHKPLVEQASVRRVTPADLAAAMAPKKEARLPSDGLAALIMGLCANYAPAEQAGRFEWLYDEQGKWRSEVWQRWLDLDPLTIVRKRPDAFAPAQRIYLDGAEHDEFGANIGARKIHAVLRERAASVTFYESPGNHSDHMLERLVRGLTWALAQ